MPPYVRSVLAVLFFGLLIPAAEARTINIVAFGDSNTAGFLTATEDSYPYRLEAALRAKGHDVRVINSGVNGATSGAGLARIDEAVPPGTDIAIVFFGRNDMRFRVGETRLRENLSTIVGKLRGQKIQVVLCGYYGFDFSDIASTARRRLLPATSSPGPLSTASRNRNITRVLDPLRHLNGAGYAEVVKALLPVVEPLVRRVESEPSASSVTPAVLLGEGDLFGGRWPAEVGVPVREAAEPVDQVAVLDGRCRGHSERSLCRAFRRPAPPSGRRRAPDRRATHCATSGRTSEHPLDREILS